VVPLALSVVYAFGFLTAAIPRSGGDYVLVSRILHPSLGVVSSTCMTLSSFLSIAFDGLAFTTLGVVPLLTTLGLVSDNHSLIHAGSVVASSKGWQFGIGTVVILVGCGTIAAGWRWAKRFLFGLFGFALLGLVISALVALFTSRSHFIASFNTFAKPWTHESDTYHSILNSAAAHGINTHPAFSLTKTWPIVAVLGTSSIYAYWSTMFAGELRQGSSLKTANRMGFASLTILACALVFTLLFFHSWGRGFLTAAFGGQLPSSLGTTPSYYFLTSAQLDSVVMAAILCGSFAVFWLLQIGQISIQPPRTLFAWSFDGLLPASVARVSRRGMPITATIVTTTMSVLAYAWAIYVSTSFFQVIVYATLIQLITHLLIGISAISFPYRRRELYESSVSTKRVLGVPLVVVAGIGCIFTTVFLYYCFFHYSFFGLAVKGRFFVWLGGALVFGFGYYLVARAIRRRQGVSLDRVYAEIPPE
jgi:amino acid transporter